MPDHPLHKRIQDLTKNRLKRTSLNHVLKDQQRKHSDILAPRPEECKMIAHNRAPLVLKAEVEFSIPGISTKSSDSEASLKTLPLAELDKSYPTTVWTQVFTDGSAESATRNRGCGIYIRQSNKPPITIAIPGGDMCSNYRAEAQAQRLSPSWRQDQRRLCSSQTPYLYCNHSHQLIQKTTSYEI